MSAARDVARRIASDLADADKCEVPEYTWYGYVSLDDVRELVGLVLAEPLPQESAKAATEGRP